MDSVSQGQYIPWSLEAQVITALPDSSVCRKVRIYQLKFMNERAVGLY